MGSEQTAITPSVRLSSVVVFVADLDSSSAFYAELLGMEVTVRTTSAVLLVAPEGAQLYLRAMGPSTAHVLGSIGVQYVIWTAASDEDLRRCEQFLHDRAAHVQTQAEDGFTLVEGRDPSGVPVVMTYPGPDHATRHVIMSRIYSW